MYVTMDRGKQMEVRSYCKVRRRFPCEHYLLLAVVKNDKYVGSKDDSVVWPGQGEEHTQASMWLGRVMKIHGILDMLHGIVVMRVLEMPCYVW